MKALFISDDSGKRETVTALFRSNFPKVSLVFATNSADALDFLSYDGPFGFIMLDVEMRDITPTDLYLDMVDLGGGRPTIFMGSFGMIKDRITDEVLNDHVENTTMLFPLNVDDFKEIIERALIWASEEEFEMAMLEVNKEDYLKMKVKNFYLFNTIPYDAYWEVMDNRFIKIITKNKSYSHSLIQKYVKNNSAKYLYLSKEDNIKFLEESIEKLSKIFTKNLPSKDELKTQIMAASIVHEYLRTVGVSESVINFTMRLIDYCASTFAKYKNFDELLRDFPLINKDFSEHSILTCYFCQGIVGNIGWNSEMSAKKLGLASLVHDCSLFNDELIKVTSPDDPILLKFTPKEREDFEFHPYKSAEIATHFVGFPETDFLIIQHHELPTGNGFPGQLNSHQITTLSATFILANNFVSRLFTKGINKASLLTIAKEFGGIYKLGNFREPLKALEIIIR